MEPAVGTIKTVNLYSQKELSRVVDYLQHEDGIVHILMSRVRLSIGNADGSCRPYDRMGVAMIDWTDEGALPGNLHFRHRPHTELINTLFLRLPQGMTWSVLDTPVRRLNRDAYLIPREYGIEGRVTGAKEKSCPISAILVQPYHPA